MTENKPSKNPKFPKGIIIDDNPWGLAWQWRLLAGTIAAIATIGEAVWNVGRKIFGKAGVTAE